MSPIFFLSGMWFAFALDAAYEREWLNAAFKLAISITLAGGALAS